MQIVISQKSPSPTWNTVLTYESNNVLIHMYPSQMIMIIYTCCNGLIAVTEREVKKKCAAFGRMPAKPAAKPIMRRTPALTQDSAESTLDPCIRLVLSLYA